MSNALKILVVEDELIIAEQISLLLVKEGYPRPLVAANYDEAVEFLEKETPDIVITDISLGEGKSGIDIGVLLNEQYKIPFIYITSLHSSEVVKKASKTRPNAYLVKPFKKEDLSVAVELAYTSRNKYIREGVSGSVLTVKDSYATIRISVDDIIMLKAEENYTTINTRSQRPRMVRQYLSELLDQLPVELFVRIHRSYVVNKNFISEIHSGHIVIFDFQLPVSRTYRPQLDALKPQ